MERSLEGILRGGLADERGGEVEGGCWCHGWTLVSAAVACRGAEIWDSLWWRKSYD